MRPAHARLLLNRNHSRHRWENQPAVGVRLEDLDREEILRTRTTAIEQRRLSAGTSMDVGDILDPRPWGRSRSSTFARTQRGKPAARRAVTSGPPSADPSRLIAALARDQINLDLKTVGRPQRSRRRKILPHILGVATISAMTLDGLPNAFSYSLAHERGVSDRRLRGLVADGALERLGHGLYRKADAPPADLDRIEIALRAPEATLCLTTALSLHDLTDVIPSEIDVALPRSRRPPRVSAPVRWHRFHEDTFSVGRETIEVDDGLSLGLYSAERSVIDAFRLRHQEGEELAVEALRRWLERSGATPADLLAMAQRFPKVEPSLLQTLRILS